MKGGSSYEKYNLGYFGIRGYPEQGIVVLTR